MDQALVKYSNFTFQNPCSQRDGLLQSFSRPILWYILENASFEQWKKLHKTCKSLFCWNFDILVDYFAICGSHRYISNERNLNGYFLQYNKNKFENIVSIWLSNIMVFDSSKVAFSEIRPKITRCEVKDLRLTNCTLSDSDLKFLTKWGKTERFLLKIVAVFNSENVQLPLEDLLAFVPFADDIQIEATFTTAETSKKLTELERTRKFKTFIIDELDGTLDHELVYKFIKKNAGINSYLSIDFLEDEENTEIFKQLLQHELIQLNWQSILEYDSPPYAGYDPDEIYWQFDDFWDRVMSEKMCCGCWYDTPCTLCFFENGVPKSNEENQKEITSLQLSFGEKKESKNQIINDEILETSSKKQKIWYFFVKKSRPARLFILDSLNFLI
uniref:F-box associated domain-containing protein n=1 Tax=Panagrolaimus superbus TaxID=310955 RepID=A0A914Z607_9BILA